MYIEYSLLNPKTNIPIFLIKHIKFSAIQNSKGYYYRVSLQKGHLKVTNKRKSTYKNFVSA